MDHGSVGREPYQPFTRESGLFVCATGDNEELRMHLENGRYHFHRWILAAHDMRDELVWRGPVAFGLTAGEVFDAAEALRRDAAERSKVQPDAQPARSRRGRPKPSVDRPEDAPLDLRPDDQRPR